MEPMTLAPTNEAIRNQCGNVSHDVTRHCRKTLWEKDNSVGRRREVKTCLQCVRTQLGRKRNGEREGRSAYVLFSLSVKPYKYMSEMHSNYFFAASLFVDSTGKYGFTLLIFSRSDIVPR